MLVLESRRAYHCPIVGAWRFFGREARWRAVVCPVSAPSFVAYDVFISSALWMGGKMLRAASADEAARLSADCGEGEG
jgi:hypothetical protein